MHVTVPDAINLLSRTPHTLSALLDGLPDSFIYAHEGPDTWSPYDVIGHLIHGDTTDWIPRLHICLSDRADKTFEPFDRFAQFENSRGKSLQELLENFKLIRQKNLRLLQEMQLTDNDYQRTAQHPAFGTVTLGELLTTWVVHDLDHIYQITRVMAHPYREAVGPWKAYLRIVQ